MKEFIFGERNGIYIIDLNKTVVRSVPRRRRVRLQSRGGRQDAPLRRHEAAGAGRHRRRSAALRHVLHQSALAQADSSPTSRRSSAAWAACGTLEAMVTDGRYDTLTKKEQARNEKEKRKLLKNLEGSSPHVARLPDAIFGGRYAQGKDRRRRSPQAEDLRSSASSTPTAIPDEVDYVIPGNDDALRSIRLFASKVSEAIVAGRQMRESRIAEEDAARAEEAAAADSSARLRNSVRPRRELIAHARRRIGHGDPEIKRRPDAGAFV